MSEEGKQDWFFAFGYGHKFGPNGYIKIYGTFNSARDEMNERFGNNWSFQYSSAEKAGVEKFNLKEVK